MNVDSIESDRDDADGFAPFTRHLTAADTLYVFANGHVKAITRDGEKADINLEGWLNSRHHDME